jgi:UDP-N-acetyl-D-glucosamine dehydrogenase
MKKTAPAALPAIAEALEQKLLRRTAHVGVIGLGYVGLPLAVELARAGFKTTGVDLDARKVDAINRGESYIPDALTSDVAHFREDDRLSATRDASVVKTLDTVNICVPTPLRKTKDPDLSYVVSAVEMIAEHLHQGLLVILESTTYPGTTDEVVRPILERRGLVAGRDFFLAFSPERVDPGNTQYTTRNVPKVVGGTTPTCTALAKTLYSASIERVVEVSSTRVAEMVKLLENTFRAVNIGLVNELALMCDRLGLSVWEVVDAAATKPFGFMPFYPGPGLGGHCIPIDPFYLSWKVKEVGFEARFIELAGQVNAAMPHHVVDKVADALNSQSRSIRGSKILVLGIAYKRDVDDMRESPALDVMAMLMQKGAHISYHDPYVPSVTARDWPGGADLASVDLTPQRLRETDCALIITDHRTFDCAAIAKHARLIVDTRNAIKGAHPHVFKLGAPSP